MDKFNTAMLMASSMRIVPSGQVLFTNTGQTNWIIPQNVTSISVALIGGGGGGATSGGIAPTSGTFSKVVIGTFEMAANGGSAGSNASYIGALGGSGGSTSYSNKPANITVIGVSGGNAPSRTQDFIAFGGGGAALLSGSTAASGASGQWRSTGGTGSTLSAYPGTGSPGAIGAVILGGGAGGAGGSYGGGGGGGRDGLGGGGGGLIYANNISVTPGSTISVTVGSGGTGQNVNDYSTYNDREGGPGASGAVRIIWGINRSFPSTNI